MFDASPPEEAGAMKTREQAMLKLGGAAHAPYIDVFQGLQPYFQRQGLELDWVLYSGYDALVDAFVAREIDIAWNGPLAYVKIRRRLKGACKNVAMRDVDVDFKTLFITRPDADITTVPDLKGRRFAFGNRGSIQAGVLAHYFLQESGIDPRRDLAGYTFYDQRRTDSTSDERDVVGRVRSGEYDAGAVSNRTLEKMTASGELPEGDVRVIWSSPGYSHCCFTIHSDMDEAIQEKVTQAFVSIDDREPAGRAVLEGEACGFFVPGVLEGWDTLEVAAERESLV
jgi:phosphate/phosphite/phosphonate ABC transporter binding protein